MKRIALAAVALPFLLSGAFAQGVYIGPGGVGVDTGMGGMGGDRVVRQYQDDDGCMVKVVRHRSMDGDVTTRRIRSCE
jgi:hypothetical protein